MTIFGIGLNKTGTTSLAEALGHLGFPCLHFPSMEQVRAILAGTPLPPYAAACDWPCRSPYRELTRRYPEARFILTTRPREEWISSRLLHVYCNRISGNSDGWHDISTIADRKIYDLHHARVRRHFAGWLNYLELPLGAGWAPLCTFLGCETPGEPYPHRNTGAEMLGRLVQVPGAGLNA